jgi:peroxiredoxin
MHEEKGNAQYPDFELPDEQGHPWRLSTALSAGPAVLVFYRGDW